MTKPELKPCTCETAYTIEPHGGGFAIYLGRCEHRHGLNLALLTEVDERLSIGDLENALNKLEKGE